MNNSRAGFFLTCCLCSIVSPAATGAGPVVRWDFGPEESTPLVAHGGVHRDVPGPRAPEFPDFDKTNTAVKFDGKGAYFSFADKGAGSSFDFTNGDAITLEAWVNPDKLADGENVYVIGKGRTGVARFAADNQNWALRLRESKGQSCVSFLFATPREKGAKKADAHWRRWTTTKGFGAATGWHHIAVAYHFGKPESIRGWIDGAAIPGEWDMGGATTEAPVTDDDAVWIGSSQGGRAANSFRGSLDAIAIHRELLDDKTIAGRFRRAGGPVVTKPAPEKMPELGAIPAGKVLVTFHEGMPAHDRWLNEGESIPPETTRWTGDAFLLNRLPKRYDDWGIRESWKAPVLTRLAADVALSPGPHRLLLRVRDFGRLWVNGKVVARSKPRADSPSGEELITPVALPPLPGHRIAEHRQQEIVVNVDIVPGQPCRVVLETLVGAKKFRAEPGELCLAILSPDGKSFQALAANGANVIPLTDQAVTAELARIEQALGELDDRTRRTAAASRDQFWERRHRIAREWVNEHPAPVPPVRPGTLNPVDAFLAAKIDRALAASAMTPVEEAKKFHADVLPILRDECFRCHGDKEKGGLKLNSREAALKAGDSERPAIVPGKIANSELIARLRSKNPDERMPPKGDGLKPEQIAALENWVKSGANWPVTPVTASDVAAPPVIGDAAFLRRVFLDTLGVPPGEAEVRTFLADQSPDKRSRMIDRLLNDERSVDHWISYWQDVLAENPTLLNSTLNSTGPFRWFLHDSLRDRKPLDRMVTELIMLRGSPREGGSAGFGIASENDAPFAAKAHILGTAFLGIELQCARCHDSPFHVTKQRDLYAVAAMFERKAVGVPKSATVPAAFFENKPRESLIKATMKPGEAVTPSWPFAKATGIKDDATLDPLLESREDSRERLAALVTSPQNSRFARVIANRLWKRLMGAGIVEPVHDWEGRNSSHPELLDWLAGELISHGYDVNHVLKIILNSTVYQREATGRNLAASPELRFFAAPERRRLTAEQVVDSLHAALGRAYDTEELTFDPDGRRAADNRINLGLPKRAWMFASLANERDRPSLSLPKSRAVADVLEAFGWSGVRQTPRTDRETAPNVLQPGVLANGRLTAILTRAADGSPMANLAVQAASPSALVESVFLRILGRSPNAAELVDFSNALAEGFDTRILPAGEVCRPVTFPPLPRVTWSNHQTPEASTVQLEMERRARIGPAPDPRLRPDWREVYEDFVWSLVNHREFVWMP